MFVLYAGWLKLIVFKCSCPKRWSKSLKVIYTHHTRLHVKLFFPWRIRCMSSNLSLKDESFRWLIIFLVLPVWRSLSRPLLFFSFIVFIACLPTLEPYKFSGLNGLRYCIDASCLLDSPQSQQESSRFTGSQCNKSQAKGSHLTADVLVCDIISPLIKYTKCAVMLIKGWEVWDR